MDEPLARAIADRTTGVGCDQLIVLEPSDGRRPQDADLEPRRDRGRKLRQCVALRRRADPCEDDRDRRRPGHGDRDGSDIEVSLGEPHFEWDQVPVTYAMPTNPMPMAWGELEHPVALNVGNPHVVFFVDNADRIDLDELGPRIEHDPVFPERINVNVAEVHPDGIRLRTWERGPASPAPAAPAPARRRRGHPAKRVQSPVKVTMRGGSAFQPNRRRCRPARRAAHRRRRRARSRWGSRSGARGGSRDASPGRPPPRARGRRSRRPAGTATRPACGRPAARARRGGARRPWSGGTDRAGRGRSRSARHRRAGGGESRTHNPLRRSWEWTTSAPRATRAIASARGASSAWRSGITEGAAPAASKRSARARVAHTASTA